MNLRKLDSLRTYTHIYRIIEKSQIQLESANKINNKKLLLHRNIK